MGRSSKQSRTSPSHILKTAPNSPPSISTSAPSPSGVLHFPWVCNATVEHRTSKFTTAIPSSKLSSSSPPAFSCCLSVSAINTPSSPFVRGFKRSASANWKRARCYFMYFLEKFQCAFLILALSVFSNNNGGFALFRVRRGEGWWRRLCMLGSSADGGQLMRESGAQWGSLIDDTVVATLDLQYRRGSLPIQYNHHYPWLLNK